MHPGCGMKFLVQPLSLYRFCTGLWWLSCPLQFLLGWVLHSCPGSCSGVFSHISRYFSFWSLKSSVSYLCEGYSVLCDCLWISWYYFSFQFLTLWNTLKHSNHFVCSSSSLWPSTVLLLSLNWLLLFSAWCCLSFKENAMLKIPCSFIKALGKFLTNSNFIEISKLYLA